jgi:hypothetical protein
MKYVFPFTNVLFGCNCHLIDQCFTTLGQRSDLLMHLIRGIEVRTVTERFKFENSICTSRNMSCERGNEPSGFTKVREFVDWMNDS